MDIFNQEYNHMDTSKTNIINVNRNEESHHPKLVSFQDRMIDEDEAYSLLNNKREAEV
jgi:hypothetical protein